MRKKPAYKIGDRVAVWITQRDDVLEGDRGIVVAARQEHIQGNWYYDVILDTAVRLGNYHEGTFVPEEYYKQRANLIKEITCQK